MTGVYGDWRQWVFVGVVVIAGIVFIILTLHWQDKELSALRSYDPCMARPELNITEMNLRLSIPYCAYRYSLRDGMFNTSEESS